jgi:hypothetical protein
MGMKQWTVRTDWYPGIVLGIAWNPDTREVLIVVPFFAVNIEIPL